MKTEEAIKMLKNSRDVLEFIKVRVREIEDDENCLHTAPHTCLRGSSAHIDVALERIKTALKWQSEAQLEQHNNTSNTHNT